MTTSIRLHKKLYYTIFCEKSTVLKRNLLKSEKDIEIYEKTLYNITITEKGEKFQWQTARAEFTKTIEQE